jgi:hypothetical protein
MGENELNRRNVLAAAGATGLAGLVGSTVAQGQEQGRREGPEDAPTVSGAPTIRTKAEAERAMEEAKKLEKRGENAPKDVEADTTTYRYVYGNCLYHGLLGRWHWWSNYDSSSLCDSTYKWSARRDAVVDHYEFFTCPDGCRAGWIKIRVG